MVNHTRVKIKVGKKNILHMQCMRQSGDVLNFNALGHSVLCILKWRRSDLQFVFFYVAGPNIIIFMTDNLSIGDLSISKNSSQQTPNIDRLAREGVLFSRWYT